MDQPNLADLSSNTLSNMKQMAEFVGRFRQMPYAEAEEQIYADIRSRVLSYLESNIEQIEQSIRTTMVEYFNSAKQRIDSSIQNKFESEYADAGYVTQLKKTLSRRAKFRGVKDRSEYADPDPDSYAKIDPCHLIEKIERTADGKYSNKVHQLFYIELDPRILYGVINFTEQNTYIAPQCFLQDIATHLMERKTDMIRKLNTDDDDFTRSAYSILKTNKIPIGIDFVEHGDHDFPSTYSIRLNFYVDYVFDPKLLAENNYIDSDLTMYLAKLNTKADHKIDAVEVVLSCVCADIGLHQNKDEYLTKLYDELCFRYTLKCAQKIESLSVKGRASEEKAFRNFTNRPIELNTYICSEHNLEIRDYVKRQQLGMQYAEQQDYICTIRKHIRHHDKDITDAENVNLCTMLQMPESVRFMFNNKVLEAKSSKVCDAIDEACNEIDQISDQISDQIAEQNAEQNTTAVLREFYDKQYAKMHKLKAELEYDADHICTDECGYTKLKIRFVPSELRNDTEFSKIIRSVTLDKVNAFIAERTKWKTEFVRLVESWLAENRSIFFAAFESFTKHRAWLLNADPGDTVISFVLADYDHSAGPGGQFIPLKPVGEYNYMLDSYHSMYNSKREFGAHKSYYDIDVTDLQSTFNRILGVEGFVFEFQDELNGLTVYPPAELLV